MDMYPKYKSKFGYQINDQGIDSYGVDHSGFSIADEINYQTAREQREAKLQQLLQCELAKISPESRRNGIALGYAKEYLMDYPKKRFLQHYNHNEIMEDSKKICKIIFTEVI